MAKNLRIEKRQSQDWARELYRLDNFYVLDTETTGLDKRAEIVQLGVVDRTGRVILDTLIRPTRPVPSSVTAIHGITNEMLADAPTFADLYVRISSVLAGSVLIAYNMDFDWRMLVQSAGCWGLPPVRTGSRHCAMKQYARFHGQWNSMRGGYRWHKLAEAARQQRITVTNAHNAIGDCMMTLALIEKMANYE